MTLPLRGAFNDPAAEGILVSRTTQEGEVWRVAVWDGSEIRAAAVRAEGSVVAWEHLERWQLEREIQTFEKVGPTAESVPVLATDGEIWDIVIKRRGEEMRWWNLVHPDHVGGEALTLKRLASHFLFGC